MNFLHGFAIAIDYAFELLFWWKLEAPMTISSKCGLALRRGERTTLAALLGRFLNWLDKAHTELAIQADTKRLTQALDQLNPKP